MALVFEMVICESPIQYVILNMLCRPPIYICIIVYTDLCTVIILVYSFVYALAWDMTDFKKLQAHKLQ